MTFLFLNILVLVLVICITVADCTLSLDYKDEWTNFKMVYKKNYKNKIEENMRFEVFMDNKKFIISHNDLYDKGVVSYRLGINSFSDLTHDEFMETISGKPSSLLRKYKQSKIRTVKKFENVNVPDEIDWREKGAVTPVKYQGNCKSSWAFSATGALEGLHYQSYHELISLSEQNLMDCSKNFSNFGCEKGDPTYAFLYVADNQGIAKENAYPYTAQVRKCRFDPFEVGTTSYGFALVANKSENDLKNAVALMGPVSVAIDASLSTFMNYKSGIYYDEKCSSNLENLTSYVLAVGYGVTLEGTDYWIVKNSWSNNWGEDGYMRLARNRNNTCGIATHASIPL